MYFIMQNVETQTGNPYARKYKVLPCGAWIGDNTLLHIQ